MVHNETVSSNVPAIVCVHVSIQLCKCLTHFHISVNAVCVNSVYGFRLSGAFKRGFGLFDAKHGVRKSDEGVEDLDKDVYCSIAVTKYM